MAARWNKERYRQEQEAFVSNHGGTTSQEVVCAILPNVCSLLLTTTTLGLLGKYLNKNVRTLLEFVLTVVPCILCCTILSEHIVSVCLTMILISIGNIMLMGIKINDLSSFDVRPTKGRRPFVTNFRALTNIITSICILAIDFRVFPRKFAKTEVFGYSLMDTGVGLFILANALVAPEARDFENKPRTRFFNTLITNIRKSVRNCTPLLILGFGRFVAVEYIGYQKHVTEYGVHWNFFITLAFVKLFTSTITSTINSRYSLLSGIWILAMHEYILSTKGLKEWILSNGPRDDFVSANREGLISVPGFVGLYLVGVAIGRLIHSTYQNINTGQLVHTGHKTVHVRLFRFEFEASYNESMVLCVKLSLITAQACTATLFCDSSFRVSRRLANSGYCIWIITLGAMMLTLLLLVEVITDILTYATMDSKSVSDKKNKAQKLKNKKETINEEVKESLFKQSLEIFEAVNYNGLFFFLLCNVMTGTINILVLTLYVKQAIAMQILIAYMAISILSVLILYRRQIQIKL